MVTLPQKNATLLRVKEAGTTLDWDNPDSLGGVKFEGRVDGFYTQRRERVGGPGAGTSIAETLQLRRQLIVDARRLRGIEVEDGDTVHFLYRGEERHGVVVVNEEYDIPNTLVPAELRLTLRGE